MLLGSPGGLPYFIYEGTVMTGQMKNAFQHMRFLFRIILNHASSEWRTHSDRGTEGSHSETAPLREKLCGYQRRRRPAGRYCQGILQPKCDHSMPGRRSILRVLRRRYRPDARKKAQEVLLRQVPLPLVEPQSGLAGWEWQRSYLRLLRRAIPELSWFQQVLQPPVLYRPTLYERSSLP